MPEIIFKARMRFEFRLLSILLVVAVIIGACSTGTELEEEDVNTLNTQTKAAQDLLIPSGPTRTRRPVPTPFPTEETVLSRSESSDPAATIDKVNEEVGEGESEELTEGLSEEERTEVAIESILGAHRAGLTVDALRASITNENLSNGESNHLLLEFVRPDSYRMVTENNELIVAAGQTFFMDESANWLVSPGENTDRFEGFFDPFIDKQSVEAQLELLVANIADLRFLGEEPLNDILTRVFTYVEQTTEDGVPVQTTVWIGSENGLLYRQVITFDLNGEDYRLTTTFEYGDSVRVEPPLP